MNGTKPSILQRRFKFKVKQPLTFPAALEVAGGTAIGGGSFPVDLNVAKFRWMLVYPIPAEPSYNDDIAIPYTSVLRVIPKYFVQTDF